MDTLSSSVKDLSGLYTSRAQDACASTRLAGPSLLSRSLKTPPLHKTLVYLRNVAKRHPHASRTWQVPRYPLGLPYRELLQGAISVALRARHLKGRALALQKRDPFFTVARGPVPRDRWSARDMARDRPSPYVKGRRFFHLPAGIGPISVVCDRPITNRSRSLGRSARASDDLDLQISMAIERWRGTGPRPT